MPRIVAVDPVAPRAGPIAEAVEVLRGGGLVVYPTRCLYGLGCDATNPAAVAKVFAAKGRPADQPISVICKTAAMVEGLVEEVTPPARKIMNRFWPGAVTIVLKTNHVLPPLLGAGTGTIAVRQAAHAVAAAMAALLDRPVTATSANLSGRGGCHRVGDLSPALLSHVDLVLDAGELDAGVGSTVVDAAGTQPVIIREGLVAAAEIMAIARGD